MKEKLIAALAQLDGANDNHWTAEGLPRLDTIKMFAQDGSVTRQMLDEVAPGYTRSNRGAAGTAPAAPLAPPAAPTLPGAAAGTAAEPVAPQSANQQGGNGDETPEAETATGTAANAGVLALTAAEAEQAEVEELLDEEGMANLDKEIAAQTAYVQEFSEQLDVANNVLKSERDKLDALLDKKTRVSPASIPAHLQYLHSRYGK